MNPTDRIFCDTCGLRFQRDSEYRLNPDGRPQCVDAIGCKRRHAAYLEMRHWLARNWEPFCRARNTRFPTKSETDLYV